MLLVEVGAQEDAGDRVKAYGKWGGWVLLTADISQVKVAIEAEALRTHESHLTEYFADMSSYYSLSHQWSLGVEAKKAHTIRYDHGAFSAGVKYFF
jgi:hypothetical protein